MIKRGEDKKYKKAQVTVFVIVAVLIIGLVIGLYFFRGNFNILKENNPKGLSLEIGQVDSAFEDCLKQRAIDAIRIIGLQGGYITLPENYLVTSISNVAYGYYNGKKTLATKETIEKEISSYIEASANYCIDYKDFSANISVGKPSVKTKIENDYVYVSTKIPISITKDNKVALLNRDYKVNVPIRLGNMLDIANEIINREIKEPDYVQLTYLSQLSFNTAIVPYTDESSVYFIIDKDNKTKIDNVPYTFMFANEIK